ncbi:hypothetical protein AVEN_86050-1 [Araneus ventricosus]|uniref:Uncharacterized protein n=1 Tax=Araneus ventricosus TaxID=182803 RepID=A0A4Y2MHX6_ARAVE|nr:hypothetical protein AVEN_86050-1 [Araneus ventricosus]
MIGLRDSNMGTVVSKKWSSQAHAQILPLGGRRSRELHSTQIPSLHARNGQQRWKPMRIGAVKFGYSTWLDIQEIHLD